MLRTLDEINLKVNMSLSRDLLVARSIQLVDFVCLTGAGSKTLMEYFPDLPVLLQSICIQ